MENSSTHLTGLPENLASYICCNAKQPVKQNWRCGIDPYIDSYTGLNNVDAILEDSRAGRTKRRPKRRDAICACVDCVDYEDDSDALDEYCISGLRIRHEWFDDAY